ncbi:MAG: FecR domain-containing protein, partial [Lachnospiraceae bacterium]|nr:FecR domain-containing protein [Lachnospiraceae bacterium]
TNKKPIIIGAVAAVVVVAVVCVLLFSNKAIRATTMRMLRMEGTVSLEENGKVKAVREDLRLKSGNAVNTEAASLCSIGLDDTKIVTMNEVSRAEFSQKGKALELNLTKGSLYFEVSKKLASDESFEIQTSTMVLGIRGTSGYVSCDEEGHEYVLTTDGSVHVIGTNPQTGEVKEIDVPAGSKIVVYLYNDRTVDSIMFALEPVTEDEIPEFVIARLQENEELLDKVVNDTGWSKPVIMGEEESEPEDTSEEEKAEETTEVTEETTEEVTEEVEEVTEPEPEPEPEPQSTLPEGVIQNPDGTFTLSDGTVFDPNFYREQYSDLAGMSDEELLNHYLNHGKDEKRSANQTEQDQKDAEEAAKQAEQNSHDDDDDDGDDGSSDSGQQQGDPAPTYTYDATNNEVRVGDTVVGEYIPAQNGGEGGQFTVYGGTHSMPMTINGEIIHMQNLVLTNDTAPGTEITVGGTKIRWENNHYVVYEGGGGAAAAYDLDPNEECIGALDAPGRDNPNNRYTGLLVTSNDQKYVITDEGNVVAVTLG